MTSRIRAWAGVGAFIALLAIALVSPSPVTADCSHRSDRPTISLDYGRAGGRALIRPVESDPPPPPCSGPQCSGKSAPVPGTVAPPVLPDAEWALIMPTALDGSPPAPSLPTEATADRPIGHPSTVFHPPRRSR